MKKKVLFLAFLGLNFIAYNQNYSYSFSCDGISPEQLSNLENKIRRLEGVEECKIRYKEERKAGEIMLFIEEVNNQYEGENESSFNAVTLKNLLLESGLSPLNFKSLN